jgi:hypothetical protein
MALDGCEWGRRTALVETELSGDGTVLTWIWGRLWLGSVVLSGSRRMGVM